MNSDDPKFTAHVLGECEDFTTTERAEIEALVFGDPAAAAEAAETRALAALLRAELAGEAAAGLKEGQRAAVLKAASAAVMAGKVVPFPRRTAALAALAASLVVGVTVALVYREIRETPVGNLPVTARILSETPVAIAASNIRSAEAIPPSLPISLRAQPAPQVQFGNITVAESANDQVLRTSVGTLSAPQLDAMLLNYTSPNNGATIADAGAFSVVTRTFVTNTTTLNYAVTGRNVRQAPGNEVDFGTFRVGGPPVVVEESKTRLGAAATFTVYIGSTVTGSSISTNTAGEQQLNALARRNRTTDLAAASLGEIANVKETAGGKDFTATVSGAVGSNTASLEAITENGFLNAREKPLSTFGADVGTDSYAMVRRSLEGHQRPPQDVVRIEELLNYFSWSYPPPQGDMPFSATMEVGECPWAPEHRLVRIGLQAAGGVNVQVEFNPAQVSAYRLIGDDGRSSARRNDLREQQGAGEISAGRTVTALYELIPAGKELPSLAMLDKLKDQPVREPIREKDAEQSSEPMARKAEGGTPIAPAPMPVAATPAPAPVPNGKATPPPTPLGREMLTVKLRYQAPDSGASQLLVFPLNDPGITWEKSSPDFRFVAAVAGYGMLLRDSSYRGQATWQSVAEWAREGLGADWSGQRKEFLELIEKARAVSP